ncbi:MAG: chemotaxis protein [unclassified Hahellaceae]|nr:chemotaxis protein [Hahellaceae bacterium]|tara:strand:+ start:21156 stop:23159 length:2004 start_codon:yes stop_codon:yes gene_type:complete
MPFYQSVSFRLSCVAGLAISVFLAIAGYFLLNQADDALTEVEDELLASRASSAATTARVYSAQLIKTIEAISALFGESFVGRFEIEDGQGVQVGSQTVPQLLIGGEPIAGNYSQVDSFAEATGGNATIFVRSGNDFIRVVTSVKQQNGSRAVGTSLSKDSPAYQLNLNGKPFNGTVTLFGKKFITNYTPIMDSRGGVIGIRYVGVEFTESLASLLEGLSARPVGKAGFIFILDSSKNEPGNIVSHPKLEGNALVDAGFVKELLASDSGEIEFTWPDARDEVWNAQYVAIPELDWVLAAAIPHEELQAPVQALKKIFAIAAVVVVLVTGLILMLVSRRLVRQPLAAAISQLEAIAAGDYTRTIEVSRNDELGLLEQAMRDMQRQVREVIGEIGSSSQELAVASRQLTSLSLGIAKGSKDQRDAATSMASTIEELTTNIEQLSQSAAEAQNLSEVSQEASRQGVTVIRKADQEMQRIAETVQRASSNVEALSKLSDQVGTTIQVIENIAEQTNLLALNAAIESARAGEAGRGFAVVADEVRGLAARTTQSAKQITDMIKKMREGTRSAVKVMNDNVSDVQQVAELAQRAGSSIEGIQAGAIRVFEVFSDISERLNEQSKANEYVAEHVVDIGDKADSNDQAVQNAVQAANELEAMAEKLQRVIKRFRVA